MINNNPKIEYVKISVPNSDEGYISRQYKIGDSTITVEVQAERRIYLKTPQEVKFCYITKDAMYSSDTQLLALQYSNYIATFILKAPQNFKRHQNRKYIRVKAENEAIISYRENNIKKTITSKIYDISAGGVRFTLKEKPQFDGNVKINLILEGKFLEITAGLVKYYYKGRIPQVSFEFMDLPEDKKDIISNFCYKKLTQESNKKN